MSYSLNADQLAIQDLIRRVARDKVAARADAIDRTAEYPHDMFDLLKELGLFALPFPEKYGGTGSLLSGCLAVEEFGRVCYNTGYLLVVQWVAFGALLAAGTEEQQRRFLPGLASGALRGAFSTTEAQSGSDVSAIKTRAEPAPGGYRLTRCEDLVHELRHRRLRPGRRQVRGFRRQGQHQSVHRRKRHARIFRGAQRGKDGRSRGPILSAVLR